MDLCLFILSHVSHKQYPDVACSGHITSGPHGDVHSSLSYLIWDTKRPDSLSSLIETWEARQNYFYTKRTWNFSSFHPLVCAPYHQCDFGKKGCPEVSNCAFSCWSNYGQYFGLSVPSAYHDKVKAGHGGLIEALFLKVKR